MRTSTVLMLALSVAFLGCGGQGKVDGLVPVNGTVKKGGAPLGGATVTLYGGDYTAAGTTDPDGNFSLRTRGEQGVTPGDYQVTVVKIAEAGAAVDPTKMTIQEAANVKPSETTNHTLPARYASPDTSGLRFTVTSTGPNTLDIDITE